MTEKFNIVLLDCITYDAKILNTTLHFNDAVAFVSHYIEANFDLDDWFKCVHINENTLEFYQYNYIFPKVLKNKIHIIKFTDCTICM